MNKDFDFDKVGKRMPYQVPDCFFDQLESNVMQEVKSEVAVAKKSRFRRITWGTIIGARRCGTAGDGEFEIDEGQRIFSRSRESSVQPTPASRPGLSTRSV